MYEEVMVKVHRSILRKKYGNGQIYLDYVDEQPSMSGGHKATVSWGDANPPRKPVKGVNIGWNEDCI